MKEIKIIKEDERQKIILIYDERNNKKYIQRRIYDDKRDIYKTVQRIHHPNIPEITDVSFDGDTIVTEEYIDGKSLSRLMEEKALKKRQIKSIAKQLVSAMSELHKSNIIHRDIKPDNIIMNESGHIWLIDYDIARIYRREIRQDTEVMGTFGYAPIEQYGMLPTDFKTDIYAFGSTLCQLMDHFGMKGSLYKIAQKCKRLDPSQRYENSEKLKRAIQLSFLRNPLLYTAVFILVTAACISAGNTYLKETKQVNDSDAVQSAPDITEDTVFSGFEEYPKYTEYKKYPTIAHSLIFSVDEPWEHLLFIDDINMKGKIKLGKKNTLVSADITLKDGELSVDLSDKYKNTFNHKFKYENQYSYEKSYTDELRKNADIICRDLDYDGVPELLIGLNEGAMGVVEHQFYNPFNYCIGWCVKYDEETGFTLCEGDMFSKEQAFTLTRYTQNINVFWENVGDIMGYKLEDNKIVPI